MKLSRIHDLTRTISEDMQVYPRDPRPKFEPHVTIKEDGKANVTRITLGSHTGTHVDAPWHFLQDGNGIDMEPLDKFVGEAAIIDASGKSSITAGDFSGNDIRSGDIVLLEAVKSLSADEIARLEDRIVVATTGEATDSFAYLKRLGGEVSPGVRILENVGMKGSALAISMSAQYASGDVPVLHALWRVHGTLRFPR
ncbi:MAG: cyclase family protein [Nitrososphaera sp.]